MRVSTKQQAEVQHGSLEQQRHMLERWSLQQSEKSGGLYQITRFFEEDISGRGKAIHKRMALMEIERAIETKSIDFVVFEKVDRLARDIIYNLGLVKKAQENGVEVHEFESGQIDLRDRGSRLGFNIKNLLAEEYSLDLEEKITKKQREARINNGKDSSTFPILGLDPHPAKRGMYIINKKEQDQVLDIFKKFIEVGSLKAIVEYCKENRYVTKIRMTREKSDKEGTIIPSQRVGGDPIDSAYLRNILTNPKIRGYSSFKDTWNQFPKMQDSDGVVKWDYPHGAVVPIEIFNEAQIALEKNAKFNCRLRGQIYYLSNILFYEDGSAFSGAGAHGRNTKYQYYHCPNKKIRIRKEKIERLIVKRVKEYLKNSDILKKMIGDTNALANIGVPILVEEVAGLKRRLAENKKVIEGFSNFIRQSALTEPTQLDQVIRTITAERDKAEIEILLLERELANKENQLRELKSEDQDKKIRDYLKDLLENFDSQKDLKKRDIIQLIIPKIIIHEDNKLEIWVRRDLGEKSFQLIDSSSNTEYIEGFGQKKASCQPLAGMVTKKSRFSEKSTLAVVSSSFGLSHIEESGSSELELAGWTEKL